MLGYCKVPEFSDARKLCCNLPKIQGKRPNLKVLFIRKEANGIANSEDPDQTAHLGLIIGKMVSPLFLGGSLT